MLQGLSDSRKGGYVPWLIPHEQQRHAPLLPLSPSALSPSGLELDGRAIPGCPLSLLETTHDITHQPPLHKHSDKNTDSPRQGTLCGMIRNVPYLVRLPDPEKPGFGEEL